MPSRDRKSVISGSSIPSKVLELLNRSVTSPPHGDAALPRPVPKGRSEISSGAPVRLLPLILGCAFGWSSLNTPSYGQTSAAASNSVRLLSRSPVLSERTQAGFQRLSPDHTGIRFINELSVRQFTTNQIYLNGSGVAAGDVDGDGLTDLYFAAIAGTNRLFRNLGAWKFQDITQASGTGCEGLASTGAMLADLDGDGDLDLAVATVGNGLRLFQNNGTGVFQAAGVLNPGRAGMSMAIADVDGDGRLDLYVCNYRMRALRDLPGTNFRVRRENGVLRVAQVNGQSVEESPELAGRFEVNSSGGIIEHGEPDILYRCTGNFQYSEQRFTSGTFQDEDGRPLEKPLYEWGLSVMFRDLNADLLPDLYVCNDFDSPDRIWLNMGRGQFRAAPSRSLRNTPKFSMGVDVADVDRDGLDDILILDMLSREHSTRLTRADRGMEATGIGDIDSRIQVTRNTLQWNRGGGVYSEIGSYSGLDASEWAWTPLFLDVDLDGWEDVLISTGHGRDDMHLDYGLALEAARRSRKLSTQEHLDLRTNTPPLLLPQLVFRNLSGLRFQETNREWGLGHTGIVHGMCLADLDNDGDLDVVGNALNGPAMVYQNQASASRVAVRLQGLAGNTRGIGARIRLLGGAVPLQAQEVVGGGRYLSSDDPIRVFAASTNSGRMRLEVDWRSGRRSVVEDVTADRLYLVAEAAASPPVERPVTPPTTPLFEALRLPHVHFEDGFDDFVRQPLLPRRLSQLGPGLAWLDWDADGWEDLAVGAGAGGKISLFRNNQKGGWVRVDSTPWNQPLERDALGMALMWKGGVSGLCVASASYQETSSSLPPTLELFPEAPRTSPLPALHSSASITALADIDGDGDLDLFVGGRVVGGRYPEPASSAIHRYDSGTWVLDETNAKALTGFGLVTGGLWSDLDGDGDPDLAVTCEWGTVRVLLNQGGVLKESTQELGFAGHSGWWNGLAAGDFDGDGRMDLVAANWGLNGRHALDSSNGVRVYHGDYDGDGTVDILEASFEPGRSTWVPERDLLVIGKALPFVRDTFSTHAAFSRASIADVLGGRASSAGAPLAARYFETTLWLNRGGRFEPRPLPMEAQMSPVFGISVADMDGNGTEDLFLTQNFFGTHAQAFRSDAGRGLVLLGDGKAGFRTLRASESGVSLVGEGRGVAACDFDGDGKVDVAAAMNGAETIVYRNVSKNAGIRVRVNAGTNNRGGIGVQLRAFSEEGWGPVREIRSGSGTGSQDSLIQVLHRPGRITRIQARWPHGKVTEHKPPADLGNSVFLVQPSN